MGREHRIQNRQIPAADRSRFFLVIGEAGHYEIINFADLLQRVRDTGGQLCRFLHGIGRIAVINVLVWPQEGSEFVAQRDRKAHRGQYGVFFAGRVLQDGGFIGSVALGQRECHPRAGREVIGVGGGRSRHLHPQAFAVGLCEAGHHIAVGNVGIVDFRTAAGLHRGSSRHRQEQRRGRQGDFLIHQLDFPRFRGRRCVGYRFCPAVFRRVLERFPARGDRSLEGFFIRSRLGAAGQQAQGQQAYQNS